MDKDGNKEVSTTEFKEGLQNLKIILNQKDINNIFIIFDSDKSNSISLEEMKDTLEQFRERLK